MSLLLMIELDCILALNRLPSTPPSTSILMYLYQIFRETRLIQEILAITTTILKIKLY